MPRDEKRINRKKRANKFRTFFVIASEGRLSEPQYFRHIASFLDSTKKLGKQVILEPLHREDNASDFRRVLSLLDEYKSKYDLKDGDQLWCLVDADNWPEKHMAQAQQLCKQKQYEFCMTNPCFELWLLLHHLDVNTVSEQVREQIFAPASSREIGQLLHDTLKQVYGEGYQKSKISTTHLEKIPLALKQAFELELEKSHWTFDACCTRIHELIQQIFKSEPPDYPLPE
jgi:hypothetical protein